MQLITILLIIMAVLSILSGGAILVGSRKGEKLRSAAFCVATLGAGLWAASIAAILALEPGQEDLIPLVMYGVYIPAVVMDMGFVMYTAWRYKIGKVLTILVWLVAVVLIGMLIHDPSLLYNSVTLSYDGISADLVDGWYYWLYLIYFVSATFVMASFLIYDIAKGKNKGVRVGNLIFLAGFSVTGMLSLIFDILLPFWVRYDLIWVGPMAIGFTIVGLYYAILRYKLIQMSASWLKVMSYVILMTSAALVYMIIFFVIFTALFKIPNPSTSIFVLNFVMVVIVMLLMPVLNETLAFINSLISTGQVDIAYIVKRLNKMANNVDYNELASFLADHLHFSYIGFLIDGRLYGSGPMALSTNEIREVSRLKAPEKGVWQEFNQPVSEAFHRLDINAVAQLDNAKGKPFGQILVGKPQGKMGFEHRDLIQLEMIINLVAALIDTGA